MTYKTLEDKTLKKKVNRVLFDQGYAAPVGTAQQIIDLCEKHQRQAFIEEAVAVVKNHNGISIGRKFLICELIRNMK